MSDTPGTTPGQGLPAPYAHAYTPAGLTRSSSGLAIATFVVAAVFAGLLVVNNVSAAPAIRDLVRARETGTYNELWGSVYDGTALAILPATVLVWVVTCIWLGLVRRNAEAITPDYPHRRAFGWVWAGWIVPIVNLWFPYQVVRDVYRASGTYHPSSRVAWALGGWWWTAWLALAFGNRVLDSLMTSQLDELDLDPAPIQLFGIVATVATLASLVLWGLVIRTVVRVQRQREQEWVRT